VANSFTRYLCELQAVVRAKRYTTTAVNTNEGFPACIEENSIHRTRPRTLTAVDAQVFLNNDPPAFALGKCTRGANLGTGGGVTGKA